MGSTSGSRKQVLRMDFGVIWPPRLKSVEPFAGDKREGKSSDMRDLHTFHLCLIGVNWVESKTLGDRVAMASPSVWKQ